MLSLRWLTVLEPTRGTLGTPRASILFVLPNCTSYLYLALILYVHIYVCTLLMYRALVLHVQSSLSPGGFTSFPPPLSPSTPLSLHPSLDQVLVAFFQISTKLGRVYQVSLPPAIRQVIIIFNLTLAPDSDSDPDPDLDPAGRHFQPFTAIPTLTLTLAHTFTLTHP